MVPREIGNSPERGLTMPANEEPKQEESIKDQPATPDLEIEPGELEQEDADKVAGGMNIKELMT